MLFRSHPSLAVWSRLTTPPPREEKGFAHRILPYIWFWLDISWSAFFFLSVTYRCHFGMSYLSLKQIGIETSLIIYPRKVMLLFNLEVCMIFFFILAIRCFPRMCPNIQTYFHQLVLAILACCDSWGRKESDTTEQLNLTDSTVYPCYIPCHSVRTLLGMASIY